MLADAAASNNVPVDNLQVDMQPGQIMVSGRTRLSFFQVQVAGIVTITVEDGRPVPHIETILVNGQPVTGLVTDQIMNMVQPYLDQYAQTDLGVQVKSIQIDDTQMVIEVQN